MKPKLQVAIITRGNVINAWQYSVCQDIEKSHYADLALHIIIENSISPKIPLAWKIFSHLDNFIFKPRPYALSPINNEELNVKKKIFKDIKDIDTKDIRNHHLDVIINFSNIKPTKEVLSSTEFGVWNLAHFNHNNEKQGPPGVWELIQGKPEIRASLNYVASGMSHLKIMDQTSVCTDWIGYSRNSNVIHWQATPLIGRNLKKLYEKRLLEKSDNRSFLETYATQDPLPSFEYPDSGTLLLHTIKTVYNKTKQIIRSRFYFDQWILLFSNSSDTSKFDLSQYKRILPPKDRFWADPFLYRRNGKLYLFFEELIYKDKLGHISVMELDEQGNFTTPEIILKKDYHLSYPFIFEEDDTLYMVPETGSKKNIQLYKCTQFPYIWELEKVLMEDVVALDTTIFKKDNLYWMFANIKVHQRMSSNVELFLFSSKNLVSDQWTPHPLNPIVTNVKKSRPAGKIFVNGNHIMRPSQNCSYDYGYGININTISKLNEIEYKEEITNSILPNWSKDVLCTHTLNSCSNFGISDALILRRRFF